MFVAHNPYCYVCRREIKKFEECTLEHIIPVSKGGSNSFGNLTVSHEVCNVAKGNSLDLFEWISKLIEIKTKTKVRIFNFNTDHNKAIYISRTVLNECFSHLPDLLPIINSLYRSNNLRNLKRQNHEARLNNIIKSLQKLLELEDLILLSEINSEKKLGESWKLVFGLCFLERYNLTGERYALLHAIWKISSIRHSENFQYFDFTQKLLLLCSKLDNEVYYRFQKFQADLNSKVLDEEAIILES